MIYLCDLDNTLADISHRLHYIQERPQDWDAFYDACRYDVPIDSVIEVVRALHKAEHVILIITGRSDVVRKETHDWLANNRVPYDRLVMRRDKDHREDYLVKEDILDNLIERGMPMKDVGGVFEDRGQVVDMYRKRGIRVFQVDEGKF